MSTEQRSGDGGGGYTLPLPSSTITVTQNAVPAVSAYSVQSVIGVTDLVRVFDGPADGEYILPRATGSGGVYTVKNASRFRLRLLGYDADLIDGHNIQTLRGGSSIDVLDYQATKWGII